jgi:hypothetical protein
VTVQFYFDDNYSDGRVVAGLRRAGVTVVTSLEAGNYGVADELHLAYAADAGLVLITSDEADFQRLSGVWLAVGRGHAGIVIVKQQRYGVGEQLRRLLRIVDETDPAEMKDRVEFLSSWPVDR